VSARRLPLADLEHILERTPDLWRDLDGAHILVTGGTGFVGTWLLESLALARQRHGLRLAVTALSRDPGAFAAKVPHLVGDGFITLLRGDVRDFPFPRNPVSHVIHAAFDSGRAIDSPRIAFETIVDGTRCVLDGAGSHPVQRMLFLSSGATYGAQPFGLDCMPEDFSGGPDPASPLSAYGEGKRAAEFFCSVAAADGLPVSIARCFAFIGPGLPLDAHFAAGNFLRDAARGAEIVVNGDGRPMRSYLYAADLAIWLWTILLHGKAGRPYNVGSAAPVSIGELARLIAGRAPAHPGVRIAGVPDAAPPPRYVPCVRRAMDELGLRESIGLDDAIVRNLKWLVECR
jgi:nucleoside-diphosphate-sugar epimerase